MCEYRCEYQAKKMTSTYTLTQRSDEYNQVVQLMKKYIIILIDIILKVIKKTENKIIISMTREILQIFRRQFVK